MTQKSFLAGALVFVSSLSVNATTIAGDSTKNLHLDWCDKSIAPTDNFYLFANGQWLKNNPIPSHYASWSSFSVLNEQIEQQLHQLVTNAAADKTAKPGSLTQKVGDFYASGMDVKAIERIGIQPLIPYFSKIDAMVSLQDLPKVLANLHLIGVSALFDFGDMQDFKDSTQMIAYTMQGGLTLPDRDYYLKQDEKFASIRTAYLEYIRTLLQASGEAKESAQQKANLILQIETEMAKISMPKDQLRDPKTIYHMMSLEKIHSLTPLFDWPTYLTTLQLKAVHDLNVATPSFLSGLNTLLKKYELDAWKTYLKWHVLASYAEELPQAYVQAAFKMKQALSGVKAIKPRWKRVLATENNLLGFAVGELYVQHYVSPKAKSDVLEIMHNIRDVLAKDLASLPWMTQKTREAALKKLKAMDQRVGYPDKWWDYTPLKIDRLHYVENVMRASQFITMRHLSKIGKPIDKTEWAMTPQTVNAYYDSSMNNINIPIGILMPPFFDVNAPAAVNYGAIGAVIGHEITHGFDDQGAQFDGQGNLINWWTAKDLTNFKQATACIAQQYSKYQIADLYLNGQLVVGEATADLGGLTLAYRAFQRSKNYQNAPIIDGYTPLQQFFIGFAHVWANHVRPEQARMYVLVDPHPPAEYRVNGTLKNMPEFRAAFGQAEHLKTDCEIW